MVNRSGFQVGGDLVVLSRPRRRSAARGADAAGGAAPPSAPILSLISVVGATVTFGIAVDESVVAGDSVRLQIAAAGSGFASPISDTNHTITGPEDAANEVDLTLGLPPGNWDARALVHHITDSSWSNTVSFSIVSALSVPTYVGNFSVTSSPAGNPIDYTFTFPAISSGNLLVVTYHGQSANSPTAAVFDPAGQNVALTRNALVGAVKPCMFEGVLGASAGGSLVIRVTYAGAIQFNRAALNVWLISGQASNTARAASRTTTGTGTTLAVLAGQSLISSAGDATIRAWNYATSTPVLPSAVHGSGSLVPAAEWAHGITTAATYNAVPLSGVTPVDGAIFASYD